MLALFSPPVFIICDMQSMYTQYTYLCMLGYYTSFPLFCQRISREFIEFPAITHNFREKYKLFLIMIIRIIHTKSRGISHFCDSPPFLKRQLFFLQNTFLNTTLSMKLCGKSLFCLSESYTFLPASHRCRKYTSDSAPVLSLECHLLCCWMLRYHPLQSHSQKHVEM